MNAAVPADAMTLLREGPVLLYDGECGVCSASVQWVLRRERQHSLRFAALGSAPGEALRELTGVSPSIDSVLWVRLEGQGARALVRTDAVREVLAYVGGPLRVLGFLLGLVPRPLRDLGYRLFARHRKTFAPNQCLLPTPAERARFLGLSEGTAPR